jgi:uncharacterized protein YbjT (DUF2867 family)
VRHRFGTCSLLARHAALDAVVVASGIPWTIVHPGLTFQTAELLLAPVAQTSRVLPDFLAAGFAGATAPSRISLVHADDVADVMLRQLRLPAVGKHIGVSGAVPRSAQELVDLVNAVLPSGTPPLSVVSGETIDDVTARLRGTGVWSTEQLDSCVRIVTLAAKGALFSTSLDVHMALKRDEMRLEDYLVAHSAAWH